MSLIQIHDFTSGRSIEREMVLGRVPGFSVVSKLGVNRDIDTGTLPEDIWGGGGVYTGFPIGAPQEIQLVSTSAGDTGTVTMAYLESSESDEYKRATISLTGTTPVNTGIFATRVHTAFYTSANPIGFNAGTITVRHRLTPANIFLILEIGRSQSTVSAYTVPAKSALVVTRIFAMVSGGNNASVEGALWVRASGGSPRLRRVFSAGANKHFGEALDVGLAFFSGTDLILRATAIGANNTTVFAGYDGFLVRDV